jgi:exonuclease I
MALIFYDFETTELSKLGQILNFSFIVTDERFSIIDEYSDVVRIERTVLPHPGAILTNRVDVIDHQARAKLSEHQAVRAIADFLSSLANNTSDEQLCLVGYNSAKFDLPYFHTVFIRNGMSPFGKWRNVDLFFLSQKLYHREEWFREHLRESQCESGQRDSISLSLENLCSSFGILKGAQSHESRDDVLLTIELAKYFSSKGAHISSQYFFEAPRSASPGDVFWAIRPWPNIESTVSPFLLLSREGNGTIWGDLLRARKIMDSERGSLKEACTYIQKANRFFLADEGEIEPYREVISKLKKQFLNVSFKDFYGESTCDIEDDIFRFPIPHLRELHRLFERELSPSALRAGEEEAKELFLRHRLREYEWGGAHDELVWSKFQDFAKKRFGGECLMKRGDQYPSFQELIDQAQLAKTESKNDADQKLISNLMRFYEQSDIARALEGTYPESFQRNRT